MGFPYSRGGRYSTGVAPSLTFKSESLCYLTAVRPEQVIYPLQTGVFICEVGTQLKVTVGRML